MGLVNEWIVARADPQPGQTWLDIAGGLGDLAVALAERVGHDGRVISSDFAPEMVEVARASGEGAATRTSSTACSTPSGWTSRTTASTASAAATATC